MDLTEAYREIWRHKLEDIAPPDRQHINRCNWVAELLPNLPADSLLVDLGTGSGQMLHEARKRGWKAKGYEFSAEVCKWLQSCGCDVQQADLSIDHLLETDVDIVTCCDVIEHLLDPLHAMREAHRVLLPYGMLFVATPNVSCWRRIQSLATGRHPKTSGDDCLIDGGHVGYYGALDLVGLLKAIGFSVVETVYRNPDPAPANLLNALQQLGGKPDWLNCTYQIAVARKR